MGRSAKLYKKKPKTKLQQQQKRYDHDGLDAEEQQQIAAKKDVVRARLQERGKAASTEDGNGVASSVISDKPAQRSRLKSRVWQRLEAQRAKSGMAEFSTPKQAGIDYLSQWESKKAGR